MRRERSAIPRRSAPTRMTLIRSTTRLRSQPPSILYLPLTCGGRTPTKVGTSANEIIRGTSGADVIHGLGGRDLIFGSGGDDVICGGDGNDAIAGDAGRDQLDGGLGVDACNGGTPARGDTAINCERVFRVP